LKSSVSEVILPLKMQGIAEITEHAIVFRFKFTARPVKPSWVQREYLKQIYRVFAEKGIIFASGALTLQTAPSRSATASVVGGLAATPAAAAKAGARDGTGTGGVHGARRGLSYPAPPWLNLHLASQLSHV
jgi:moderate conductance mechanosensitive channel